jgi:PKD repeat protein
MRSGFSLGKTLVFTLITLFSVISFQLSMAQTYCTPTVVNNNNYQIGMANVTLGSTINNSTAAQSGGAVYFDYTSQVVSAIPGSTVSFALTAGNSNSSNISIYIDWNRDGTFNASGTEFIYNSGNLAPSTTVTGNFNVPSGLACGPCRIRVTGDYGSYTPTPCANQYGEFEDYTFSVQHSGSPTLDVAMNAIVAPLLFASGNNTLTVNFKAVGSTTVNTVDFGYKIDNGTPVTVTGQSVSGGLAGCQTALAQFTFPSQVNVSAGSHTIKVWVENPNSTYPDANKANDTLTQTFCTTIAGTFIIDKNGTGNYTTFAQALTALECGGIHGPVLFNVKSGTYTERVVIPQIPGANKNNTIIFDGYNADSAILTYAGTGTTSRSTVVLNGADYVTFQNMTIQNTGSSYQTAVLLTNVADSNTFKNCKLKCAGNSSSNFYVVAIHMSETNFSSGVSNPASYNLFQDNLINGGYYGAWLYSGSGSVYGMYNKFIRNDFNNQSTYGMACSNQMGLLFQNNYIHNMVNSTAYGVNAYWNTISTYDGNTIHPGQYGLYLYYENVNLSGNKTQVINNIICNFKNTSYQNGIMTQYYGGNLDILHNSIWVNGNAAFSQGSSYQYAAIFLNYYTQATVIKNNILSSTGTTLLLSAMYYPQSTVQCDYNNYYYPNSANDKFYWFTSQTTSAYYSNLHLFKQNYTNISATHDINSVEQVNPNFNSSTDLHISSGIAPLYGKYVGVGKDVDGNIRCSMSPTIGADESNYPYPQANTDFTYPDTIYVANQVDFLSMSSKTIPYMYKWYVDGVLKDTLHDISLIFASSGNYTVKSVVIGCTSKDSTSHTVQAINPTKAPIAQFATNANIVTIFDQINLKDLSRFGPDSWTWTVTPEQFYNSVTGLMEPTYSWGGTSSANVQNPSLYFLAPGDYSVRLVVSNSWGTDSVIKNDYIIVMPDISMCAGEYISNNNYGKLYDDGGKLTNYSNSLACKFLITPCSPKLQLIFRSFNLAGGDYLKIYDGKDANGIKMFNETTFPNGFTGTIAPNTTFVSTTGKFFIEFNTDASTTASGFEIEWIADSAVKIPPVASFTVPDTLCLDKSYLFKNTSTGYGNKYYWDLNKDGIQDNQPYEEDITAYYSLSFADTVSLAVENCAGVDTLYKLVIADVPTFAPKVGFYVNNTVPNVQTDVIKIYDTSYRCVDSWKWEITPAKFTFKNGTNANSSSPEISFDTVGCFSVKLVAGVNGMFDSLTKSCYITALSYCIPTVNTFMGDIGISNVKIGTINNASLITSTAYTNYSSTQSTELVRGQESTIEIKRQTAFNYMSISVWIDYNMNGSFTDPGEQAAYVPSSGGLSWTGKFKVPFTANMGPTRMRIGTNIANKPNLACGTNKNGEYEDYKVILVNDKDKPVITLIDNDTLIVEKWNTYIEPGAVATDLTEGDISSSLKITGTVDSSQFGTYFRKYNVTDTAGNKADEVTRVVIVSSDKTPPVITLVGGDTIIDVYGTPAYTEPGYSAIDPPLNTNYTSSVVVTGSVDQTKLGVYMISYYVEDIDGNPATKTRKVSVVDRLAPTLTLNGDTMMYMDVNTAFTEPGYSTSDNYWTNLVVEVTGSVNTSKTGSYMLHYSCTDSSGNASAMLMRKVIVQDTIRPVVHLIGMGTLNIEAGSEYLDPGATVSDNYCLPATKPNVTGSVNPKQIGTYTITYEITDCEGNVAITVKRTVNVVDTKAPDVALVGHPLYKLIRFQEYIEDGYTVSDLYWPLSQITIDTLGDYENTGKPGVYFIQYKATDGSGNISYTEKRVIYVTEFNGINDNSADKNSLLAYPNPANLVTTIYISLDKPETVSLGVYDVLGNEVSRIFNGKISDKVFDYNVSSLAKGIYIIKLNSDNTHLTYKLIVN